MKDKEKQICETVGDVLNKIGYYKKGFKHTEEINALIRLINKLSNENIELKKKLPKDSIVLTKEEKQEYESLVKLLIYDKPIKSRVYEFIKDTKEKESKETAEKILNELYCTPKEQVENKIKELARFIGVDIKE
jgi:hypothetical protein